MDPEARRYLADLVTAARELLGVRLFGAYAAGSLALDAYQPGRSDIDVALVVDSALQDGTKQALVSALRHEALPCPARGLELVLYRRDVAASGTPGPGFEVELNTGRAMPFRATFHAEDRAAADGRFWYGLDRSLLHQQGLALLGPPAAEVFADLSPTGLRALLVEALEWWHFHGVPNEPADDAILGACRSLVKVRHGTWMSKVDAARHLIATGYQPADVVQRAIEARTSGGPAPDFDAGRAFQRQVLAELR